MRILVVGAIYGGTVPMGRAIYQAFNEIKLEADFLDYADLQKELLEIRSVRDEQKSYQFYLKVRIRLLEKVSNFKPDVIFGVAQSPLNDSEILREFKKAGIRLCYWFMEDYRIFEYWRAIAPHFDYFFTIQKETFWGQLNQIGCNNYYYLPAAFDSNLECPVREKEPEISVSFVGAPYPNRIHFFGKLRRTDFQIYGEGWNKHPNSSVVVGDRRITECEARDIYQRSVININLHSSPFPHTFEGGDFLNPRTFELAGLGAFQLTDMRKALTLHFDPAEEVVSLNTWEDMERAIDYFLEHEAEREAIAEKAQELVLRKHTYKHRAEEVLSVLS